MNLPKTEKSDELKSTLDPENWEELRDLGHRMVDDVIAYLSNVSTRSAWRSPPKEIQERFHQSVPKDPQGAEKAYHDFVDYVLPYPMGNIHPRFWAMVIGSGTPLGAFSEMLAGAMNCNLAGGNQIACHVEGQVVDWFKEILNFPSTASGLLLSGGSMANIVGLTVALRDRAEIDIRKHGLRDMPRPMRVYGSKETHNSLEKAVELLGLGKTGLRLISTDAGYRINLNELEDAIIEDKKNGYLPFCIIGNAITVNTGSVDDLNAIADICQRYELWFHVDGAIGAVAYICDELKMLLDGMERADSIAFDLHKWMYIPYEAGCLLIRDKEKHIKAFENSASYLSQLKGGLSHGGLRFGQLGPELSRGFKALKIWMSLKAHGLIAYQRAIWNNVRQAHYLGELIESSQILELLAPVSTNIVCFRYFLETKDDRVLNDLNQKILISIQESGIAVPSHTILNDKFAIRVAITNHRSTREDFNILVKEIIKKGNELSSYSG